MSGSSSTAALPDSDSGPRAPSMLAAVLPIVVLIGLLALAGRRAHRNGLGDHPR